MRSYSPVTAAYFASRAAFVGHLLVWVHARNRATGAVEQIGFWTGIDHQEFVIDGETRLYFAAGSLLKADPIRRRVGLKVQTQRISFSQIAPEAQQLFRGYDPRHAPAEVHRALFHPETEDLIDEPHILIRGFVNKAPIDTPAKGEAGSAKLEIESAARALTTLSRYRSDATLKLRAPADKFRQYASQTENVEVPWGR